MNTQRHQELLDESIAGKSEDFGLLLEYYRPYLIVLAKRYLDPRVRGRVDENDIVQVTFLEAQRDFKSFRGSQIEELLAWLRHILRNNVLTAHHNHLYAQKRAAGREVNNQADSGPALTDMAPAETSSPSQRLMKDEASAFLASCLQELPDTQQEALRLRYIEGCSLKEIAQQMNKTEMAAAGLLKRGLQALRDRMVTDSSSQGYPT
ncbi:MAG TPA: RNA polymerase subunit sigma-70 [Planctomycetaceae bacterium]|nr:RNA polymerase subunit sigma-70 [Planctomycetaceae bacterium]